MEQTRTRWTDWAATALAMLWLALFPLWQDGSYSRITHSKWMGMLLLTGVTVVVCGRMLCTLAHRRELQGTVRVGAVHALGLAYFVWVALSALMGTWAQCLNDNMELTVIWGAKRYEGLITQMCYGAIFLCMSLTTVRIRPVLTAAGDALLAGCAIVALQYADVNILGLYPVGRSIHTNYEFQGAIGNIDMVSGYVAIVMPMLLGGFAMAGHGGWGWYASGLVGVLLMLCMQVQSGLIVVALVLYLLLLLALRYPHTRWRAGMVLGGTLVLVTVRLLLGLPWLDATETVAFPFAFAGWKLLGAALGMVAIGVALAVRRHPGRAAPRWMVFLVALVLVLAVLLAVYTVPIPRGNGLWEMQELLHGRPQDAFGSERIGIWRLTLEMSRRNMLFGTGPDTFLYAMEDYMFQTDQSLVQRFDNPHNMLLAILSNNGVPALIAFMALCVWTVVRAVAAVGKNAMTAALLLGVVCYLAQGMFTFSICLVTPMFFAALGMLAAHGYAERKDLIHDTEF